MSYQRRSIGESFHWIKPHGDTFENEVTPCNSYKGCMYLWLIYIVELSKENQVVSLCDEYHSNI